MGHMLMFAENATVQPLQRLSDGRHCRCNRRRLIWWVIYFSHGLI